MRLTAWFAAIFLLSALLLFGFTFLSLYQTLRDEERQEIRSRAFGYVVRFRAAADEQAGINAIATELSNDVLTPSGTPFFARITTADNRRDFIWIPMRDWELFDFSPLTETDVPHTEDFLTLESDQLDYDLEVLGYRLSDNWILQIGGDTRDRVRVLSAFQTSFVFIFTIMLGVSLAGGLFFAARTLRPIGSLNATVRSIIETGELDRRIPSREARDDLDEMIESVNDMLDRIQSLVNGLRDALDSVAHDLRTPLTRLRSTAERALSGPPDGELAREALSDALEESDRILGMLNAMMDISEAESGAMRLRRQTVDLRQLAREAAEVYSLLAEEAEMQIDVRIERELPVHADAPRMRQVIGNLLDNAVKYGRRGGVVVVDGAPARSGADLTWLSVANEGVPIPPDDLGRIWNRLYRAGGAGDRRDGLGLGLALVKAIVIAHGGEVDVASTAERGTRFSVGLPPANITEL